MAVIASGTIGPGGPAWSLEDTGTMTVGGGSLFWDEDLSPWDDWRGKVRVINFPAGAGAIICGPIIRNLFYNLSEATAINNLENFVTGAVSDMSGLFSGAAKVKTLNISGWNVSAVTDMSTMFSRTKSLTSLNLNSWNTALAADMSLMFYGAEGLVDLNLGNWNVSAVAEMGFMFYRMTALKSLNLAGWHTQSVEDMSQMFGEATGLGQLTLGGNFEFVEECKDAGLEAISLTRRGTAGVPECSGYWQNVGPGTVGDPLGVNLLTSEDLMASYAGAMADTFVWQLLPNKITALTFTIAGTNRNGVINGTAQTITFSIPAANVVNGVCTAQRVQAMTTSPTGLTQLFLYSGGVIISRVVGVNSDFAFRNGDLLYLNNGRVYDLILIVT